MFDIGAVLGALLVGLLVDRFERRGLYLSPFLFMCAVVLFIVGFALKDVVWTYYVTIFLTGFFISGPYNLIGTVIAIDIGSQLKEKEAVSKVSSLLEGTAALLTTI